MTTRLGSVEKSLEELKDAVENMACRSMVPPMITVPGAPETISGLVFGGPNQVGKSYSSAAGGSKTQQSRGRPAEPTQRGASYLEEPAQNDRSRSTSKKRKLENGEKESEKPKEFVKPKRTPPRCGTGGAGRAGAGRLVSSFEMFVGRTHPQTTENDIRELVVENTLSDSSEGVKLENVECISELKDDDGKLLTKG